MKHIPILFSTPMVQAKKAGRKTETRRVVKGMALEWLEQGFTPEFVADPANHLSRYGVPGDILWTREGFMFEVIQDKNGVFQDAFSYKADFPEEYPKILSWTPSIHMPKKAARFFDKIKSIHIECISDISASDALNEGIEYWNVDADAFEGGEFVADYKNYTWIDDENHKDYHFPIFADPISSFRSLWQSINGKPSPVQKKVNGKLQTVGYTVYPFDAEAAQEFEGMETWRGKPLTVNTNPWVWVIKYEPTTKPENF